MYLTFQWRAINAASLKNAYKQLLVIPRTEENAVQWDELRASLDTAILHIDVSCRRNPKIPQNCEAIIPFLGKMCDDIKGIVFPEMQPHLEDIASQNIDDVINDVYEPEHIYRDMDIDLNSMYDYLQKEQYNLADSQSEIVSEDVLALTLSYGMEDFHQDYMG